MAPVPLAVPQQVSATPRVRLARLALDAALALPDVLGGESGADGLRVTADPPGFLHGVSVTAESGGRYAVDLRLVARIAPLVALGEEVRQRVQARARRDGLDAELGTVNVEFARLLTPEEAQQGIVDPGPGAGRPPGP